MFRVLSRTTSKSHCPCNLQLMSLQSYRHANTSGKCSVFANIRLHSIKVPCNLTAVRFQN
ncbi:unnamed protein product [Staurois parvus]|uniref:Uncharacterized protein n=1 Tax=Staurois parvus TaxID=386267 RepID=A0ABN9D6A7_9NEOB|nr:unnamed protein product [Staurois parvus]